MNRSARSRKHVAWSRECLFSITMSCHREREALGMTQAVQGHTAMGRGFGGGPTKRFRREEAKMKSIPSVPMVICSILAWGCGADHNGAAGNGGGLYVGEVDGHGPSQRERRKSPNTIELRCSTGVSSHVALFLPPPRPLDEDGDDSIYFNFLTFAIM